MHIEEVQLKGDNMTLLETIKSDMITAMKEKDSFRLGVIRMAKGAIQLEEINKKKEKDKKHGWNL